ncbi:MAG: hypothetical protein ACKVWR_14200 [Acidimicrobiales bacterium]
MRDPEGLKVERVSAEGREEHGRPIEGNQAAVHAMANGSDPEAALGWLEEIGSDLAAALLAEFDAPGATAPTTTRPAPTPPPPPGAVTLPDPGPALRTAAAAAPAPTAAADGAPDERSDPPLRTPIAERGVFSLPAPPLHRPPRLTAPDDGLDAVAPSLPPPPAGPVFRPSSGLLGPLAPGYGEAPAATPIPAPPAPEEIAAAAKPAPPPPPPPPGRGFPELEEALEEAVEDEEPFFTDALDEWSQRDRERLTGGARAGGLFRRRRL